MYWYDGGPICQHWWGLVVWSHGLRRVLYIFFGGARLQQYQTKCMHVICLVYISYVYISLCGSCISTLSHASTSHYGRCLVHRMDVQTSPMAKPPAGTAPEHKFQGESGDLQCFVEHPIGYKHPKRIIEVPGFGKKKWQKGYASLESSESKYFSRKLQLFISQTYLTIH